MSDALGSYQPFWAAESLLTFWIYVQRQEHPNQILPMWCPHSLLGPSSLQLWTFISLLFLLAESKIKEVGKLRQAGCPHLIIKFLLYVRWGFPGSTSGKKKNKTKKSAYKCRRQKRCRFHLWVRKFPWRRAWQTTPVFLPGESNGQRNLAGYSP